MDKNIITDFVFLGLVQADDKIEGGVPAVNDLGAHVGEDETFVLGAREAFADELGFEVPAFLFGDLDVILSDSGLAEFVYHEKKSDHFCL